MQRYFCATHTRQDVAGVRNKKSLLNKYMPKNCKRAKVYKHTAKKPLTRHKYCLEAVLENNAIVCSAVFAKSEKRIFVNLRSTTRNDKYYKHTAKIKLYEDSFYRN